MNLETSVQYLKGVGPKLGQLFERKGIRTLRDLLCFYPRAYQDQRSVRDIASLKPEQTVSVTARVIRVTSFQMGRSRKKMHEVVLGDSTGRVACKYFRTPYRGYFERFQPQQLVRVTGKVTQYRGQIQFQHPLLEHISEESPVEDSDLLLPLYSETEGLPTAKLRKIISQAILEVIEKKIAKEPKGLRAPDHFPSSFEAEELPHWLLDKYGLISRKEALKKMHWPDISEAEAYLNFKSKAQERLIFDEFFWLELYLATRKSENQKQRVIPLPKIKSSLVSALTEGLSFELTGAQRRVYQEVVGDLIKAQPMHRLIQGDVGSGKTLVALMSAAYVMDCGHQACIMAPTEILAEQHYKNAQKLFEPRKKRVGLLTSQIKWAARRELLEKLRCGEIQLLVGTHALIQEEVEFSKLSLVIVDEQHRFGVEQRGALKSKALTPHFLVMTATPIPRTLAMTVYGDLDVSLLDEMPQGRSPIVTRSVFDNKRDKVMDFLHQQVVKGRQAYIVYPLVEESEKMDLKNATDEFLKWQAHFSEFHVGLLHGKMKSQEKEEVMSKFYKNEIQILVSTTVIEVGVDVPNANIMVIEHAERFGLSQLHQLRGRVGRGEHKSYCVLMLAYASSEESRHRAETMVRTSDGFKIAEADLELRGPGEFLGTKQSGLPGFQLANLVRDQALLFKAREAAFETVRRDPTRGEYKDLWLQLEIKAKDYVA